MEERQILRSNLRVCNYRQNVRNFLEDMNSKETLTCECILRLADDNDLMCLFAHGAEYYDKSAYGVLLKLTRITGCIARLILSYAIEVTDEDHRPCFYISAANKLVERRVGFSENQLVGVLCRANQFKLGNPRRLIAKLDDDNYQELDDDEREAYDLNKKHFFNIAAEFLNSTKYVHSNGDMNRMNITYFPMSGVEEIAQGEGQLNSMVFPLLNFDVNRECYININQFFIFAETIGNGAEETITNYQAFSLATRLNIPKGMDREVAMDILEDIYDPEPFKKEEEISCHFAHFVKSWQSA